MLGISIFLVNITSLSQYHLTVNPHGCFPRKKTSVPRVPAFGTFLVQVILSTWAILLHLSRLNNGFNMSVSNDLSFRKPSLIFFFFNHTLCKPFRNSFMSFYNLLYIIIMNVNLILL